MSRYDFKKQLRSFTFAWNGITTSVKSEQNLRTHLLAVVLVVVAGLALDLCRWEWVAVTLCCCIVIAAELFNTAIECLTDLVSPGRNELAGRTKDMAAGAVLIAALGAVVVGVLVFLPHILAKC